MTKQEDTQSTTRYSEGNEHHVPSELDQIGVVNTAMPGTGALDNPSKVSPVFALAKDRAVAADPDQDDPETLDDSIGDRFEKLMKRDFEMVPPQNVNATVGQGPLGAQAGDHKTALDASFSSKDPITGERSVGYADGDDPETVKPAGTFNAAGPQASAPKKAEAKSDEAKDEAKDDKPLKVVELRALARKHNVDLGDVTKRDDIVAKLNKADVPAV